jgi:hypothetical protein
MKPFVAQMYAIFGKLECFNIGKLFNCHAFKMIKVTKQ